MAVARQNGKTHLFRMFCLTGLYIWGEQLILGTAQNRDVAKETFTKVCEVIRDNDFLMDGVEYIRNTNGQEEIKLKRDPANGLFGGRYKIIAPNSGARGLSADRVMVDELREQKDYDAHSAIIYTMQAQANAQFLGMSNAGDASSVVYNDMRERAMDSIANGKPTPLLWLEWSGKPNCKIDDPVQLAQANPALGHKIPWSSLEARFNDPPNDVRTEMLCQTVDTLASPWPPEAWNSCLNKEMVLTPGLPTWFAVDFSWDRTMAALVGAQQLPDDTVAVGLIKLWDQATPLDTLEVAGVTATWAREYQTQNVAMLRSGSMHLAPLLMQHRIPCEVLSHSQFAQACDEMLAAMAGGRLQHAGQKDLTTHVNNVAKSPVGAGGWVMGRRDAYSPVTAAVATACVIHFATQPQRSAVIMS